MGQGARAHDIERRAALPRDVRGELTVAAVRIAHLAVLRARLALDAHDGCTAGATCVVGAHATEPSDAFPQPLARPADGRA